MKKLIVEIPTPIWSAILLLITYAISALLGWHTVFRRPIIAIVLAVASFIFSFWGVLTFRRAGTEIHPSSPTNKLVVTDGPYALTRNPMYCGMVVITLAVALYVGAPAMYAAPVLLFLLDNFVIIPFEEAKMERQFGDSYRAYKAKVRRWV